MAMETDQAHTAKQTARQDAKTSTKVVKDVKKEVKPFQEFITKFNNDWVMNLASGLSFNVLTALFPIAIAIIAITGLVIGGLNPGAQKQLVDGINGLFQRSLPAHQQNILAPALLSLSKNAGLLGIVSIVLAIFGGSRLFVTLEGYFDIIYHVRPRQVVKQNGMALIMMLVFIILVPAMIFAASGPALVFSLLHATPLGQIPFINVLFGIGGILFGVLCAWIFFLVIYIVVPNQRISFRNSWLGALVAAVLVQLYLTLFPFYVTHFLNNYTGSAGAVGFAVILLFFLYYFSVILLLGAVINAFFAEKIRATPADIPTMIHQYTSYLATSEHAVQEAAATPKGEEPKTILPKDQAQEMASPSHEKTRHAREKKTTPARKVSRRSALIEAVAGTALAFVVQLFRQRGKK
jgi:YihY family inner membrane protein